MNHPTETITCDCGTSFEWTPKPGTDKDFLRFERPHRCDQCDRECDRKREEEIRIEKEEKLARLKAEVAEEIRRHTPARYHGTDTTHRDFNARLWSAVESWRPTETKPWLGMVGPSGTCKTRCAFMLLHAIVMEMQLSRPIVDAWTRRGRVDFLAIASYDISRAVCSLYGEGFDAKAKARDTLDAIMSTDVLILDDFGKARNTPSYSAEVFAILDHRHANNLCTIWTANSTAEELVGGMSEDMAGPLAGRLIECSRIINFK